jgi:DNA-binding helix-turn-helix protein
MNYLPSNLKHLRKSYGETQEELANALHLEKSTISQYENGSRKPDEEILKRIAKRYGVTMDLLLYEDLSSVPDMLAYYSNIDSNSLTTARLYPIYNLDKRFDTKTIRAFEAHKQLLFGSSEEKDEVDIDLIVDAYDEAYEKFDIDSDEFLVIAVNSLSLYMFLFSSIFNEASVKQVKDFLLKDKKSKKEISSFVLNIVLPSFNDNEIKTPQFKRDINEFFLYLIEILKETRKYSKVADYFFALRYMFNLVDNDYDYATNQLIGSELITGLSRLNNPYAKRFIEIQKKFTNCERQHK